MKKITFKQFLIEAPIRDYQTIGNWDKNSSFRSERDRTIIQNEKSVQLIKKKFDNTDYVIDLYFVNSPKANKHTEVGKVDIDWVKENLGEEVSNAVSSSDDDSVKIIFTNNKGAERRPMTAWIMAHRIAHGLARYIPSVGALKRQFYSYGEASSSLTSALSDIMEYYNTKDFPKSDTAMTVGARKNQLIMLHFFYEVATFRSARERNIRDWFEILNELFAQHITTGNIKFNPAPKSFGTKGWGRSTYHIKEEDREEVDYLLNSLSNTLKYYFDDLLSEATGTIIVM